MPSSSSRQVKFIIRFILTFLFIFWDGILVSSIDPIKTSLVVNDRLYRYVGSRQNLSQSIHDLKSSTESSSFINISENIVNISSPSDQVEREEEEEPNDLQPISGRQRLLHPRQRPSVQIDEHDRDDDIFAEVGETFYHPDEFMKKFVDMPKDVLPTIPEDSIHVEELMRGLDDGDNRRQPSKAKKPLPPLLSPTGCDVEITTVRLGDTNSEDPHQKDTWYPWCVRVPRCSGCCPTTLMRCVPTSTSVTNVTAIKLHHGFNDMRFKYNGRQVFQVEEHHSCRCECIKQRNDCNDRQIFMESHCSCVCKDQRKESHCKSYRNEKIWDSKTCSCHCRHRSPCGQGMAFSEESCRCEIMPETQVFFNPFPSVKFHLSGEAEFSKQTDYTQQFGSSPGINPAEEDISDKKLKDKMIATTEKSL